MAAVKPLSTVMDDLRNLSDDMLKEKIARSNRILCRVSSKSLFDGGEMLRNFIKRLQNELERRQRDHLRKGGSEKKRTGGIPVDFEELLREHKDEPPPELVGISTAGTAAVKPLSTVKDDLQNLSDDMLKEKIARSNAILCHESSKSLFDGGEKLRHFIKRLQNELERRQRNHLQKEVDEQKGHDHIGAGNQSMGLGDDLESMLEKKQQSTPKTTQVKVSLKRKLKKKIVADPPVFATPLAEVPSTASEIHKAKAQDADKKFKAPCLEPQGKVKVSKGEVESAPKKPRAEKEAIWSKVLETGAHDPLTMFNLLGGLPLPPSPMANPVDLIGENIAKDFLSLATNSSELFIRARLAFMNKEKEVVDLRKTVQARDDLVADLQRKVDLLDKEVENLKTYKASTEFHKDALEHARSHPTDAVSTIFNSEELANPFFRAMIANEVGETMTKRYGAWCYLRGKKYMQGLLYSQLEKILEDDWDEVRIDLSPMLPDPDPAPYTEPIGSSTA